MGDCPAEIPPGKFKGDKNMVENPTYDPAGPEETGMSEWGEEISPMLVQITDDEPVFMGVFQGSEPIVFGDGKEGFRHFFRAKFGGNVVLIGSAQLNSVLLRTTVGFAVVIEFTGETRSRGGNMVRQFSIRHRKPESDGRYVWPDGEITR